MCVEVCWWLLFLRDNGENGEEEEEDRYCGQRYVKQIFGTDLLLLSKDGTEAETDEENETESECGRE